MTLKGAVPAATAFGLRLVMVGVPGLIVKVVAVDVLLSGFTTVTAAVPFEVTRLAATEAVSLMALT